MIEKRTFGSSLCFGLLVLGACTVETVDSKNVRTGGISAIFTANATTDGATVVTASLRVGDPDSNTVVDLSGGDKIFAQAGDKRLEMASEGSGIYQVDFNTAAAETPFVIDLQREVDDDAPNSAGKLPAPFTIEVPNMSTSRTQEITITWSPSGTDDDMTLELSGSCIFQRSYDVPGDTGSHKISGGELVSVNTEKPETCDVTVEMKRTRKGTVDTAFDPQSSFTLTQTRTAKFTSAP
jgi:hypothetical protein